LSDKTWHDFLDQAVLLIEKGYAEGDDVELAKKLFVINKGREEDVGASSPPKQ